MKIREATENDIAQIQVVRNLVKENVLSDPSKVTDEICRDYLLKRGKGWVCEFERRIVGFAIADLVDNNVWALFIDPEFENRGIGKLLHQLMMDWYFSNDKTFAWLSTEKNTRAEMFYRMNGWVEAGDYGKIEVKLMMHREIWLKKKDNNSIVPF